MPKAGWFIGSLAFSTGNSIRSMSAYRLSTIMQSELKRLKQLNCSIPRLLLELTHK